MWVLEWLHKGGWRRDRFAEPMEPAEAVEFLGRLQKYTVDHRPCRVVIQT